MLWDTGGCHIVGYRGMSHSGIQGMSHSGMQGNVTQWDTGKCHTAKCLSTQYNLSKQNFPTWISVLCSRFVILLYSFKSETPLSFVLGGIQSNNVLIFGQTPQPFCLGVQ